MRTAQLSGRRRPDWCLPLDHASPVPLWAQIESRLAGAIREHRLTAGERLPAEPDLARALGISRNTLRQGLRRLSTCGVLVRAPGFGTRVCAQPTEVLQGLPILDLTPAANW